MPSDAYLDAANAEGQLYEKTYSRFQQLISLMVAEAKEVRSLRVWQENGSLFISYLGQVRQLSFQHLPEEKFKLQSASPKCVLYVDRFEHVRIGSQEANATESMENPMAVRKLIAELLRRLYLEQD